MSRIIKLFFEPVLNDGVATADPKGFFGDAQDRRSLPPFVFCKMNAAGKITYFLLGNVEFFGDDLDGQVVFDVGPDDHVDEVVGRKGVGIFLVWSQFSRGWSFDGGPRYDFGFAVDPARECKDLSFGDITDNAQPAAHVSVEGAVTEGKFGFVSSRNNNMAEFVGKGHENDAP